MTQSNKKLRTRDKQIVCRCEDVILTEIQEAMAKGFHTLEEIKRYTGFGTGPCQGKECLGMVAGVVSDLLIQRNNTTSVSTATVTPFRARGPLRPTPLYILAKASDPSQST